MYVSDKIKILLLIAPTEYRFVQCWIQSKYTNRGGSGDNHQVNVLICMSLPQRVLVEQSIMLVFSHTNTKAIPVLLLCLL